MNTPGSQEESKSTIGLLHGDSLPQAAHKILQFYFQEMLSHEEGTRLGEDPEALHDMRVATRRMRAVFDIFPDAFKSKTTQRQLAHLRLAGRSLGKVRDWDVFIARAKQDFEVLPAGDMENLSPVMAAWQAEHLKARSTLIEYLNGAQYKKFIRKFGEFASTPGKGENKKRVEYFDRFIVPKTYSLRETLPHLVFTRLAEITAYPAELGSIVSMPASPQHMAWLHALRIDVKRLHYLLDFFTEILSPESKTVMKSVKKVQDNLGNIHDISVALQKIGQFPNLPALGIYQDLKHTQMAEEYRLFGNTWAILLSNETRKLFAELAANL